MGDRLLVRLFVGVFFVTVPFTLAIERMIWRTRTGRKLSSTYWSDFKELYTDGFEAMKTGSIL